MEQVEKFHSGFLRKGKTSSFTRMDKPIALFCPSGVRSAIGFSFLLSKGFSDVRILMGGYPALMGEVMPGKVLQLTLQEL